MSRATRSRLTRWQGRPLPTRATMTRSRVTAGSTARGTTAPGTTERSLQRAKEPGRPRALSWSGSVEQLLERAQEGEPRGLLLLGCVLEFGGKTGELALTVERSTGTPGTLKEIERDRGLIAEKSEQVHLCKGER